MKPFLMGAEIEYSMAGFQNNKRLPGEIVHSAMVDGMRAEHAWLPDARGNSGTYLDTGARYYLDQGPHNELASPELQSPRDVALYDRAGERMVMQARNRAMRDNKKLEIRITKNNVNSAAPGETSWGQHEAFTCWVPLQIAAPMLIPHLISRAPYAGAGCLSAHPQGIGFELSQRAQHMTCATGASTTHHRAIFCTRAYKASDMSEAGWTRVNLISKDSQRTSFGMYLSYGITGLLFLLVNDGHEIGKNLSLKSPVSAMRTISLDPWLKAKVELCDGRSLTALEIQRCYLDEAEPFIQKGDYPEWTTEILSQARETFDLLQRNPMLLAGKLDAYLKLQIFDRQLSRAGHTWPELRRSLQALATMRNIASEAIVYSVINEQSNGLVGTDKQQHDSMLTILETQSVSLDHLRFATRMQALEQNYHELGGLFDQLDQAGQIEPFLDAKAVEQAIHNPPSGGRAEARSRCIRQLSGQTSWSVDWQGILNRSTNQWYDMRDPFSSNQQYELSDLREEILDSVDHRDLFRRRRVRPPADA